MSSAFYEQPLIIPMRPQQVDLPSHGNQATGYLNVAEFANEIPFDIKRVFWSVDVPNDSQRGNHAHYHTHEMLMVLNGEIIVETESLEGDYQQFVLSNKTGVLYLPPKIWRKLTYKANAILMVIASEIYDSEDYIYDKKIFDKLKITKRPLV